MTYYITLNCSTFFIKKQEFFPQSCGKNHRKLFIFLLFLLTEKGRFIIIRITTIRIVFVYTNGSEKMHNPTLRVTEVLNFICKNPGTMRLRDISRELNMPKSTLLPILQTLVQQQYINKDASDCYFPGSVLLYLGASARSTFSPEKFIRDHMKLLVENFEETCYYGVLEQGQVLYVEKIDSPQPLRMLTTIGHKLPAYATGLGKALLLDHSKEQLKAQYGMKMESLTGNTITNIDKLYEQLTEAKKIGYTWEIEESTEHIRCFAVPVRKDGKIQGAVSMAFPVFRYREDNKQKIIAALKNAAQEIENCMQLL